MEEDGFTLEKERSRRYPARTIMDFADDIAPLANTPTQAKCLLGSLEWEAGDIGLSVSADKTENGVYVLESKRRYVHTKRWPSETIVKFQLLRKPRHLQKMTSIRDLRRHGQLSIGYRSYGSQTYLIKEITIFPSSSHVHTTEWMHHFD